MNNYNVLDRPLKPNEIDYISKHIVTKKKQKEVAFCLTKKGLVKDLSAVCKKVRKDFREYSKTLPKVNKPKVNKPKPPCKPGKVRINGRCKADPKAIKPKPPCKPGKIRINGRCKADPKANKPKVNKPKVNKPKVNKPKVKKPKKSGDAELYVLTANKTLNPMTKTNIRLNNMMKSNINNLPALMNPIDEKQSVIKYVKRKVKSGDMVPGDIVFTGTYYTSRPEYGFGIVTGMGTIDTTFGSNDLTTILYGEDDDIKVVREELKSDFNLSHDKVLRKVFRLIDFLNSY